MTRVDRHDTWLQRRSANLLQPTARLAATITNCVGGANPAPTVEQLAARPPYGAQDELLRELISSAADGDPLATHLLLESVQPVVLRYCRARIGRTDRSYGSADNVAQEVCLALLLALQNWRERDRSFLALAYDIARQKVAARTAERDPSLPMPEVPDQPTQAPGPEQRSPQAEVSVTMTRLLAPLSARQREVLVLRVVLGLSAEQTAGLVGCTPTAVRAVQHRAMANLRQHAPFSWPRD